MVSTIAKSSVKSFGLTEAQEAHAVIKASEVLIAFDEKLDSGIRKYIDSLIPEYFFKLK